MVGKIEEIIELRRQHRDPDGFNVRSIDTLCDEVERLRHIEDAANRWADAKPGDARALRALVDALEGNPRPGSE